MIALSHISIIIYRSNNITKHLTIMFLLIRNYQNSPNLSCWTHRGLHYFTGHSTYRISKIKIVAEHKYCGICILRKDRKKSGKMPLTLIHSFRRKIAEKGIPLSLSLGFLGIGENVSLHFFSNTKTLNSGTLPTFLHRGEIELLKLIEGCPSCATHS